jgi:hypothetical protein
MVTTDKGGTMPQVREQLVEVLSNPRGFTADHRAAILEDAMHHVAREEIQKAHGEEAAEELREVQEDRKRIDEEDGA